MFEFSQKIGYYSCTYNDKNLVTTQPVMGGEAWYFGATPQKTTPPDTHVWDG